MVVSDRRALSRGIWGRQSCVSAGNIGRLVSNDEGFGYEVSGVFSVFVQEGVADIPFQ